MESVYPLRLSSAFHAAVWAGQRLAREGWKRVPSPDTPVGESWETDESNVILNGQYAGVRLGELARNLGSALLGESAIRMSDRRFPLLVKFADISGPVSVHVHPDDDYTLSHEGDTWGKPEFFYVLDAAPGATITHGFSTLTSRDAVKAAIEQGNLEAMLHRVHVQVGDAIFIAPGTIHSVGSGVLLYEVQKYSDVTYRLFDHGRRAVSTSPRPLSVDKGLDVLRYQPSERTKCLPAVVASTASYDDVVLVACEQFVTRRVDVRLTADAGRLFTGTTQSSCVILSSVGGQGIVHYGGALRQTTLITKGETLVLPAALGSYALEGAATFLVSYVPDHDDRAASIWRYANGSSTSPAPPGALLPTTEPKASID